jgi:hypothetical protein
MNLQIPNIDRNQYTVPDNRTSRARGVSVEKRKPVDRFLIE